MQEKFEGYPTNKLTIIGAGIVGFFEAYYAYLDAKQKGQPIRITIYDKNQSMDETTTAHLVPSLTPDEILAVVPRGQELMNKLQYPFYEPGGIRVDDVDGVNHSEAAERFKRAVEVYGQDEAGHLARTEKLLALGKVSMDLWQDIYDEGDPELKSIMEASNFNPCRKLTNPENPALHDGYRIDLIYNMPNALNKANSMKSDYIRLGYDDCKTLTPTEVLALDPFLNDFCHHNTQLSEDGVLVWKHDAIALWRPGGCIDTKVFLPLFYDYLKRKLGQYTNEAGQKKDCLRLRFKRRIEQVNYAATEDASSNTLDGLKFFDNPRVKRNKHAYDKSDYVFCPGEAVGTLKSLGFAEPEYARFAGASLMLRIDIPADKLEAYKTFNHCMEVHQEGVVLAWQARMIDKQIFIGVAGTKAFYGDQQPDKDQAFAKNRNLLQLNMINDVLPEFISLALGQSTRGIILTQEHMDKLERRGIAERWVGTRAVAFDGFLTLGYVYNENGRVWNVRSSTHFGSAGGALSPAGVLVSQSSMFESSATAKIPRDLIDDVLTYGSSKRVCTG